MGLDLGLGGLILMMAIRGWLRGFVIQAIRLGGLVSSLYLADPVRALVRPYLEGHLPTIRPDLVDRLLWWASLVAAYLVTVGLATLVVALYRRPTFGGEAEPNRTDQFGGFLLGIAKGGLVAAVVVAGIQHYALGWLDGVAWAEKQTRDSKALAWNLRYRPAAQVWESPPVRQAVAYVRAKGIDGTPATPEFDVPSENATARGDATPPQRLELPGDAAAEELVRNQVDALEEQIKAFELPKSR